MRFLLSKISRPQKYPLRNQEVLGGHFVEGILEGVSRVSHGMFRGVYTDHLLLIRGGLITNMKDAPNVSQQVVRMLKIQDLDPNLDFAICVKI